MTTITSATTAPISGLPDPAAANAAPQSSPETAGQPAAAPPAADPPAAAPPAAAPSAADPPAAAPPVDPSGVPGGIQTVITTGPPPSDGQPEIPLTQAMNDPATVQALAEKRAGDLAKQARIDSGEGAPWYSIPFQNSGSAPVDPNKPTQPLLFNDYAIYTTNVAAYSREAITPEQTQLSTNIATNLIQQTSAGNPNQVAVLQTPQLAQVLTQAGIRPELLRAGQLESAAMYINSSGTSTQQKDRLTATLTALQGAQKPGGELIFDKHTMKGQIISATGVDQKAFDIMNAEEITAKYQEVMDRLQTPGEQHLRIGQHFGVISVGDGEIQNAQWSIDTQVELTPEQMKQSLETNFGVPQHAFKKWRSMEDLKTLYNDITTATTTAGDYNFKIGKFNLKFKVDNAGQMSDLKVDKKRSFLSKWGGLILNALSFVPFAPVAMAARVAAGAFAARAAARAKNFAGVVAGAASVVGGIGSAVGAAASGAVAATANAVATGANTLARVAYGVKATADMAKADNPLGVIRAGASVVSAAAGGIGKAAESVGKIADNVSKWAGRAETAVETVDNIKNNKGWENTLINGTALIADSANDIKDADDNGWAGKAARTVADATAPVKKLTDDYGDHIKDSANVIRGLRGGDTDLASIGGLSLTHRLFNPEYAPAKPATTDKSDPTQSNSAQNNDQDNSTEENKDGNNSTKNDNPKKGPEVADLDKRAKPNDIMQAIHEYGIDSVRAWGQAKKNDYRGAVNLALRLTADQAMDPWTSQTFRSGAKPMVDAANDGNELRRAQEKALEAKDKAAMARAKGDAKAESDALIEAAKAEAKAAEIASKIIENYTKFDARSKPIPVPLNSAVG